MTYFWFTSCGHLKFFKRQTIFIQVTRTRFFWLVILMMSITVSTNCEPINMSTNEMHFYKIQFSFQFPIGMQKLYVRGTSYRMITNKLYSSFIIYSLHSIFKPARFWKVSSQVLSHALYHQTLVVLSLQHLEHYILIISGT